MSDMRTYFDILFDDGEFICPCYYKDGMPPDKQCTDIRTYLKDTLLIGEKLLWVSLNPFKQYSTRSNDNVLVLRNFILESDTLSLQQQQQLIFDLKMPYSTCVFSGGKSLHYVISLENPLSDIAEWKSVFKRLHNIVLGSDPKMDRPCVFTRTPGVLRVDKERIQTAVRLGSRIPNDVFFEWLNRFPYEEPEVAKRGVAGSKELLNTISMSADVTLLVTQGIVHSRQSRHDQIYYAALDLRKEDVEYDDALEILIEHLDKINFGQTREITEGEIESICGHVYK